jgi:hypothetical protein
MELMGLIEKVSKHKNKNIYYENNEGEIVAKKCKECGEVRELEGFHKNPKMLGGRINVCRKCTAWAKEWDKYRKNVTLLGMNLIERKNVKGRFYYTNSSGENVAIECLKCKEVKLLKEFPPDKRQSIGVQSHCHYCKNEPKYIRHFEEVVMFDMHLIERKLEKGRLYYTDYNDKLVGAICGTCEDVRLIEDFHNYKASSLGITNSCKMCSTKHKNHKKRVKVQGMYSLDERRNHAGIYYYTVPDTDNAVAKQCTSCKEVKFFHEYEENDHGGCGYNARCKACDVAYYTNWYEDNKERVLEQSRLWAKNNPEKQRAKRVRRRTLEKGLEYTLTEEEKEELREIQNHKCILSESSESLELEHFVPLNAVKVGTTFENCYYMNIKLNRSKGSRNPFEWIKYQDDNIKERFYTILVPMMAERNNMNVIEFEEYVTSCFVVTAGV